MAVSAIVLLGTCESPLLLQIREASLTPAVLTPEIRLSVEGQEIPNAATTDVFADAVQGEPLDVVFTIHNDGTGDLVLRDSDPIEFSGTDAGLFDVHVTPGSLTIAPGASTTFTIRFTADGAGTRSAQLALYNNTTDRNPYTVGLTSEALPWIQLLVGSTEIPNGGSYDFGSVAYTDAKEVVFTIRNLGRGQLDLTGEPRVGVFGTGYSVIEHPPETVGPLGSATFTVRFGPTGPGAVVWGIGIDSSDTQRSPYAAQVLGAAYLKIDEVWTAAGSGHSLAKKVDGTMMAWGDNWYGQLGDGTTVGGSAPVWVSGLSDVAAMAAGSWHSVALKADGTVWAWGWNWYGQLGIGDNTGRPVPVHVTELADVVSLSAGSEHTVALKNDGTVWTWGRNNRGQLGNGSNTNSSTPVQVLALTEIVAVAAGGSHTLALASDGSIWAWGYNWVGQLGDGTDLRTQVYNSTPVQVSHITDATAIAAGGYHSVALTSDGVIWAWGSNSDGQLGNGTTVDSSIAVQADGLLTATAIAAGGSHTVALRSNGTVWAWGYNMFGQLGDGTEHNRTGPVQVLGLGDIATIAAGNRHSIAVKYNGSVWVWGNNNLLQLGIHGTTTHSAIPVQAFGFTGLAAGRSHTVALRRNGTVWAWGENSQGQIGDNTTENRLAPTEVPTISGIVSIAAGCYHTVALSVEPDDQYFRSTVWTWGWNGFGQLGDGTITHRTVPAQVPGLTGIVAIAAGNGHTVSLKDNGTVWIWGDGSSTPAQIPDLTDVDAIAAGYHHSVALKSDGTVWTWGRNDYGQLGDGTNAMRETPVPVSGLEGITAIGAGEHHTIAITGEGYVWAWGANFQGQLGDETTWNSAVPVPVSGLSAILDVAGGYAHTVAASSNGTLWTWGGNNMGELGDGTTWDRSHPGQVTEISGIVAVAAGSHHSVALETDGSIWSWGYNKWGQLGDSTTIDRLIPVLVDDDLLLW